MQQMIFDQIGKINYLAYLKVKKFIRILKSSTSYYRDGYLRPSEFELIGDAVAYPPPQKEKGNLIRIITQKTRK